MKKGDPGPGTFVLCALLAGSVCAAQPHSPPAAGADIRARAAAVESDPALQDRLLRLGRKVAIVCAHCHGAHGIAVRPDVPILTAQKRGYLLEQLQQFADGRRRAPLMEEVMAAMSVDEMVGAALYFSSQPLKRPPGPPGALSADAGSAGTPPESGTSTAAAR